MPRPHLALLLPALLCPGLARATDFVVTSTADSGSGTLREAIEEANDDEGGAPHRITFDLGDTATIALESALDYLEHATTIDGIDGHPSASCQPRGTPHQLAVQIRAVPDSQLGVIRTLAPLTVRGLALVGYDDEGIILEGAAHGSSVQCSYFGMQLDGVTAEGSQGNDSIDIVEEDDILPTDVVIGTDGDGVDDDREWNLFVATDRAIRLKGPEPDGNLTGGTGVVIAGNLFGLAATGQAPPVDPKTGEPALGIQGDVIRVDGPYRGVQIGQPCTGGSPEQANVFGWFGDDALDIDGIDLGADELCFAGNQVHLTLGEELVGDHVAGSGIELDGGHYGLQVVSNRFARLTYGVRIDGADTFDQGIAPYAVQIDDNLFGDPNHPDRAVRRAVELSLVTGADITANAAYGGLEAEGYPSLAGAGANLSGSHATIEGNTFSGLTSAIRLLPEYHNVDPQSEMLGPDDILAVASITGNTFATCTQAIVAQDVPVDPTHDDRGATVAAANTYTQGTPLAVVQTWRMLPEMVRPPVTPVAWTLQADPMLEQVSSTIGPFTLAVGDAQDRNNPIPTGYFLGHNREDNLRDVTTWPIATDYARDAVGGLLEATYTDTCGTLASADGDGTTHATDSGYGQAEGRPTRWGPTNAAFGTLFATDGHRYQSAEVSDCPCGNGFLDAGEACDDGNLVDGDGCTQCEVDDGYVCADLPLVPTGVVKGLPGTHGATDTTWTVPGGSTGLATIIDPDTCLDHTPWARVSVGPAQAQWLQPTPYGCTVGFPDNTPATFAQAVTLDAAALGPSVLRLWVSANNQVDSIQADGAPIRWGHSTGYRQLHPVAIATEDLAAATVELGFTVTDTAEDGGFLALPGPSSCARDSDGDGIGDSGDDDSDGDGLPDAAEGLGDGTDPTGDHDLDGIIDAEDADAPGFVDSNGDGVDDRLDPDGDGHPAHRDLDADGGGVSDADEVDRGTDPLDPFDDFPSTGDTGTPTDTAEPTDTGDPTGGTNGTTGGNGGNGNGGNGGNGTTSPGTQDTADGAPIDGPKAAAGCGCSSAQPGAPWWTLLALPWLGRRRRRSVMAGAHPSSDAHSVVGSRSLRSTAG